VDHPTLDIAAETRRAEQRFTLMLRTAKLVGENGEFLCVIRDVSASGVRLRLFYPLPHEPRLALELSNGTHYFVETVWEKNGEAGFRFAAPIDVGAFMAEASPYPKRPIRLRTSLPATVSSHGTAAPAVLHDISQRGAGIETGSLLALDQLIRLEAAGLPPTYAKVRWRNHPHYGLIFEQTFRLDELGRLAGGMQTPAARSKSAQMALADGPTARFA
jgi:hypothetical protein